MTTKFSIKFWYRRLGELAISMEMAKILRAIERKKMGKEEQKNEGREGDMRKQGTRADPRDNT